MASDDAAEGSRSRRRMYPLYLTPPLFPRPPGLLDAALHCPVSLPDPAAPAPVATATDEPVELPNTRRRMLSPPQRSSIPPVHAWLYGRSTDGEEGTDAVDGTNSSPSASRMVPRIEGYDDPPLAPSSQVTGGVEIEATTPELRFQRTLDRIRHRILRTGSANRSQRASSPEADRLSWAIQRSHDSLETAKRQKLDGDNTVGGKGAVNKDGCCGCNSSFECNICLDTAKEPVVTPCGHLFCWPCLYKWLHEHSVHSECPVCKGEVLEVNVTPIYGRGGDLRDTSSPDMPPRPRATRTQSLRQQLQIADSRQIAAMVRQLRENYGTVRSQPNPVEAPVVPATRLRATVRRLQRQDAISVLMLNTGNIASENSNQVPLPPSDADHTMPAVPVAPEQSSSVEQMSASSTAAVIAGEPGTSRRSRPSESPTTRRTRRRQP